MERVSYVFRAIFFWIRTAFRAARLVLGVKELPGLVSRLLYDPKRDILTPKSFRCLLPANRYRLFLAITIQLNQQLTGNTSLAYYAPQIFKEVGAGTSSLLVTGFFGIIKVVSVGIFIVCTPT